MANGGDDAVTVNVWPRNLCAVPVAAGDGAPGGQLVAVEEEDASQAESQGAVVPAEEVLQDERRSLRWESAGAKRRH
eukprot:6642744-Pyramimonas_sp.AAC.1